MSIFKAFFYLYLISGKFLWKANFPKAPDYGEATFSRKIWKTANVFGQGIYDGKNKHKIRGRGGFGYSF
jgi:hypothetical protein